MKKFLSILLVVVLALLVAACGKEEAEPITDDTIKNSVTESVLNGKIPEVKYALGTAVEDIDNYYNDLESQMEDTHEGEGHVHNDSDIFLYKSGGELTYSYEIGAEKYFYEKAKKDDGISVICTIEDAFGFKLGTAKSEVEAALAGLDLKTVNAGEDELYFVP
ncbi:MAG: hypothetical protein J6V50_00675, partial [Clostridia bacterium]|nr:hypothetical protein [Clostridia bacterium]